MMGREAQSSAVGLGKLAPLATCFATEPELLRPLITAQALGPAGAVGGATKAAWTETASDRCLDRRWAKTVNVYFCWVYVIYVGCGELIYLAASLTKYIGQV
jgi:hypothetical protein